MNDWVIVIIKFPSFNNKITISLLLKFWQGESISYEGIMVP